MRTLMSSDRKEAMHLMKSPGHPVVDSLIWTRKVQGEMEALLQAGLAGSKMKVPEETEMDLSAAEGLEKMQLGLFWSDNYKFQSPASDSLNHF